MKKTASLFLASVAVAAAVDWKEQKGFNCWDGHGAEEIDTYPVGRLNIAECQAKCLQVPDCNAVTVEFKSHTEGDAVHPHPHPVNASITGNCWRRKNLVLARCQTGTKYDTWILSQSPVTPIPIHVPTAPPTSSGFPTTQPSFIKAFVEGLMSDDGTDAKKCEGDAGDFKSAVGELVQTTVGATKTVAAAVEQAKQRCTVVAEEARKLAFSALGDVFHPQRVAKNFAATRSFVLEGYGQALELLAKKDFRDAGDKVGMAARRLVEGPQDPDSLPSGYTKLKNMNCYAGHGATDLDDQPCGTMNLDQCEKTCDASAGCQGVVVTKPDSKGMVSCYRRGSIKVDQCDHETEDYDLFVNPAVQMTSTSSAVASVAVFAVVHWGAATMSQSGMQSASATNWGDFFDGVLEGLLSDGSDLGDCVAKISAVKEALQVAKEHIGKSLAATVAAAKVAKQSCGVVAREAEKLALSAFNCIKHPDQVVQNFKDTQFDLLMELGGAFEALAGNDFATAGTLMGMSIRRVFEGKQNTVIV